MFLPAAERFGRSPAQFGQQRFVWRRRVPIYRPEQLGKPLFLVLFTFWIHRSLNEKPGFAEKRFRLTASRRR